MNGEKISIRIIWSKKYRAYYNDCDLIKWTKFLYLVEWAVFGRVKVVYNLLPWQAVIQLQYLQQEVKAWYLFWKKKDHPLDEFM